LKPKITAIVITFNDEKNVRSDIESIDFIDEIIYIDCNNANKTIALNQKKDSPITQTKIDDFSDRRDFAIQQAKNDWIVFFDLDEFSTPELEKEIEFTISTQNKFDAYYARKNFYFMGKTIKYGGWQSHKSLILFNKKEFESCDILFSNLTNNKGKIAFLKERVNNYSYKSFDSYNSKLTLSAKLKAENLYSNNKRPNGYHFFLSPINRFVWQYILKMGFLDGKEGFILAYIHSFAVFKTYLQLWMMYRKIE
jgi:hypothetical protein